jgi:Universal stress protein family
VVFLPGDFVQLLHVVDKSEKFIDEMLHTDIRLKCAAINDPAVDFVFDRFEPRLVAAHVEHRINVLRCSQAARTVGEVIITNAARIKAGIILMAIKPKNPLKEMVMGSCASYVLHRAPCPVMVVRGTPADGVQHSAQHQPIEMEAAGADLNT